ncbi:DUF6998 domain-containing protein [Yersinia canariae]|uniref:DUF6998 domain-containing protein n=1 Tax=Yersinia canariae TaxID=2607663 RepID=UPI00119D55B0|nr:hypothetical protein [Yersinia canariae]
MSKNHLVSESFLTSLSDLELLSLHSEILIELRSRGVIRTKNNPVGDYAEWLVSKALGMTLLSNSSAGADAIDTDDKKVQIKARRVTPDNPSRQLSALRNYEAADFDYLIAVIFDETYNVLDAYKIPHEVIRDYARHSDYVNAHIVNLKGAILTDPRVISIKEDLIVRSSASAIEVPIQTPPPETMEEVLNQPEKITSSATLARLLKAIGMECFVNYYHHFADSNLSSADIIEQMHSREGYTEKSCRSRLSKARKVIGDGLSIEALTLIADSGRIQDSVRNDSLKLISVLSKTVCKTL